MMKKIGLYSVVFLALTFTARAQKKLSEATIYYDMVINTGNTTPKAADMLDGATNIIYLKGNISRSDMISSLGSKSTIHDAKSGTATIFSDYGSQKYMITFTAAEWKASNKQYEGVTHKIQDEYRTIAGYKCQKATGNLSDGTVFTVYFTRDLVPVNNDFQYMNKNLPGLVMQYEAAKGKAKVTYTVSNIDFAVVPLAKFDIPKSGYRVLSYTESQAAKK